MQLVRHASAQEELMRTPPSLPAEIEFDVERANATIAAALASWSGHRCREVEAKGLLAAYGIPVVPTEIAHIPAEVGRLAGRHGRRARRVRGQDPFR